MNTKLLNTPVKENIDSLLGGSLMFFDNVNVYLGEIKRVYSVFSVGQGIVRGFHAHKVLKQLIFCSHGKIKVTLNDGHTSIEYLLDHPSKFLYIGPMIWRTIEWIEENSVLVVLASDNYDESDYIRDHDEFLRIISNEKSSI